MSPSGRGAGPAIALQANVGVDADTLVALARSAEAAGFEGVFTVDYSYDSLMYDLAIALGTERVRVGTMVARMFSRHPMAMAEAAAAVEAHAPGRLSVGIGTGPEPITVRGERVHRWGMPARAPGAHAEEYMKILKMALTGEPVTYEGDWYRVYDAAVANPCPDMPVYLAAGGARLSRLAGAHADGVYFFCRNEVLIRAATEEVHAGAREAGRNPDEISIAALILTSVSDDGDRAVAAMRGHLLDGYLHRPFNQDLLAKAGFPDAANEITRAFDDGDRRAAETALPEAAVRALTICGTPAECRARHDEFRNGGVDEPVMFVMPAERGWEGAYRDVIDAFENAPAIEGRQT